MATPLLAGTAALVRQYFTDGYYPTGVQTAGHEFIPMGALLRAVMINSAIQLTGAEAEKNNVRTFSREKRGRGCYALLT